MSDITMQERIRRLAKECAKGIKTEADLSQFSKTLMKATLEAALGEEMAEHLGYEKHAKEGDGSGNSRNGTTTKTLKGDMGEIELATPRDRNGTFEPVIVKKNQTRLTEFDDQILTLYAKGMTTRDIAATFEEMYDAEVSHNLISRVTEKVSEQVTIWQNRPLDKMYPIVYLDCIFVKVRQDKQIINKAVYIALGINIEGQKEVLGLWIAENEGAKFWLSVVTELKNRGLQDILIACVDGLKGFPEAINAEYPKTQVQLCIVHLMRNSFKYVGTKNRKEVAKDLKRIYSSATVEEAERELEEFEKRWDSKYPLASKVWRNNWSNVIPFFGYPPEIRKVIYTTNAIESLNSVIRKVIKLRKIFPSDQSALKVIFLAIEQAAKRWTMPIRDWASAMNRFAIEFGDRFPL